MQQEANVRILSRCYMSYLRTLAISFVSDPQSAECFMHISYSIALKAVVLGSMVWSAFIERNGSVPVHFVRLLDYGRSGLWYRPRPSAQIIQVQEEDDTKVTLNRQFVGLLILATGACVI